MRRHLVLTAVLLTLSPLAQASQWIGPFSISRFETDESSAHFLRATGFPNPDNCPNATYIKFEGSEVLVQRAIAIGLAAKVGGLQVRYLVSGCSATGYIRATSIEIWD